MPISSHASSRRLLKTLTDDDTSSELLHQCLVFVLKWRLSLLLSLPLSLCRFLGTVYYVRIYLLTCLWIVSWYVWISARLVLTGHSREAGGVSSCRSAHSAATAASSHSQHGRSPTGSFLAELCVEWFVMSKVFKLEPNLSPYRWPYRNSNFVETQR